MNSAFKLGDGIYTIPEAAHILGLPKSKLRSWISGYVRNISSTAKHFDIIPDFFTNGDSREKSFSFHALIELFIISSLRECGFSFMKIRNIRKEIGERLNSQYPFANSKIMIDSKKSLLFEHLGATIEAGSNGQQVFRELVETFYKKIDFNSEDSLAERYWPLGKEHHVVVDPHHSLGSPVVNKTNITTKALYNLYLAGEQAEFIADIYNISINAVEDAIQFEGKTAA